MRLLLLHIHHFNTHLSLWHTIGKEAENHPPFWACFFLAPFQSNWSMGGEKVQQPW